MIEPESKFKCENCGREVLEIGNIGTKNRNHCPFCLYSKHLDQRVSGDRKADCFDLMKPVGLTFKEEGVDKYGRKKQGEIMLIHVCEKCQDISINRIAGDDDEKMILEILNNSADLSLEFKEKISADGIKLLEWGDEPEVRTRLFGRQNR